MIGVNKIWWSLLFVTVYVTSTHAQSIVPYHARLVAGSQQALWDKGPNALATNPAVLGLSKSGYLANISVLSKYQTELSYINMGMSYVNERDALGFSISRYGIGGFYSVETSFGYAKRLGETHHLAASIHLSQLQVDELPHRYYWDLSVGYTQSFSESWSISAALISPMSWLSGDSFARSLIDIGAQHDLSDILSLGISCSVHHTDDIAVRPAIRYQPLTELILYLGTDTSPESMSFGAELRLKKLFIIAGYNAHPLLGGTPVLSIQYAISG